MERAPGNGKANRASSPNRSNCGSIGGASVTCGQSSPNDSQNAPGSPFRVASRCFCESSIPLFPLAEHQAIGAVHRCWVFNEPSSEPLDLGVLWQWFQSNSRDEAGELIERRVTKIPVALPGCDADV